MASSMASVYKYTLTFKLLINRLEWILPLKSSTGILIHWFAFSCGTSLVSERNLMLFMAHSTLLSFYLGMYQRGASPPPPPLNFFIRSDVKLTESNWLVNLIIFSHFLIVKGQERFGNMTRVGGIIRNLGILFGTGAWSAIMCNDSTYCIDCVHSQGFVPIISKSSPRVICS